MGETAMISTPLLLDFMYIHTIPWMLCGEGALIEGLLRELELSMVMAGVTE